MIYNANLPDSRCRYIVMSAENNGFVAELEKLGIEVIGSIESKELPYNERFHADMQIHNCGYQSYLLLNDCSVLKNFILRIQEDAIINVLPPTISNKYPNNIKLNGAHIGSYYICSKNHSDKSLLLWYIDNGIKILNVNQGYARCSTAIVSANAIITDDETIYKQCKNEKNIDVLKISKGSIMLNGYDYGFIGGSCFKIDKNTLVFTGNARLHNDYNNIKAFCRNYGVDILSLSNKPIADIGGAVIIK